MKRSSKFFSLFLVGFFSFFFFLYFLFPYQILKETLSTKIFEETGLNLMILELSPKLPLGVSARKVIVSSPGKNFEYQEIDVRIRLLPLFVGKVGLEIDLIDKEGGTLEFYASMGMMDLISPSADEMMVPKSLIIQSENFDVGSIVNFFLAKKAQDATTNALLKPLFENFQLEARMNVDIDFSLNASELEKSEGKIAVNFPKMKLSILDPTLALPSQDFNKAMVQGSFKNGVLDIDKGSGLQSTDLSAILNGKITQKQRLEQSVVEILFHIELKEALKKQFGWLLGFMGSKNSDDGKISVQISGPLSPRPMVTVL